MKIDYRTLTPAQRQNRQNVRNYLLVATIPEIEKEIEISKERKDEDRARFCQEVLDEAIEEATEAGYDKLGSGWVG